MGECISLLATSALQRSLEEAVVLAWPRWERLSEARALPNWSAFFEFSKRNDSQVVFGLYDDGPWSVWVEPTPRLPGLAREKFRGLSKALGRLVCIWIETHGGCAGFQYFENGDLLREVANSDGDVTAEGMPRPEEAGANIAAFSLEDAWSVWTAYSLSSPYDAARIDAFAIRDLEVEERLAAHRVAPRPKDEVSSEVCHMCGKPLVVKQGRNGRYLCCSGYPTCVFSKKISP